jgi:hypothetical protein
MRMRDEATRNERPSRRGDASRRRRGIPVHSRFCSTGPEFRMPPRGARWSGCDGYSPAGTKTRHKISCLGDLTGTTGRAGMTSR